MIEVYSVGDKVIVKDLPNSCNGIFITPEMKAMKGQVCTISKMYPGTDRIKLKESVFFWTIDMVRPCNCKVAKKEFQRKFLNIIKNK